MRPRRPHRGEFFCPTAYVQGSFFLHISFICFEFSKLRSLYRGGGDFLNPTANARNFSKPHGPCIGVIFPFLSLRACPGAVFLVYVLNTDWSSRSGIGKL